MKGRIKRVREENRRRKKLGWKRPENKKKTGGGRS